MIGDLQPPAIGHSKGFTLLEITLVLLVVGILSQALLKPFGALDQQQRQQRAEAQLVAIKQSLIGYLAHHRRLPCPAVSGGQESLTAGGECVDYIGFLPSATLGLRGATDAVGAVLDPWQRAYRYALSDVDISGNGLVDLITVDEINAEGISQLQPDLTICSGASAGNCTAAAQLASHVPAVFWSLGPDDSTAGAQSENLDDDKVFAYQPFSQSEATPFDDQVMWISRAEMIAHLLRAGAVP